MTIDPSILTLLTKLALCLHGLGLLSAVQAIMKARTPQGAIAWAVALVSFPYVSLPLFWIFGRDRFAGYTVARRLKDTKVEHLRRSTSDPTLAPVSNIDPGLVRVFEGLVDMRFTSGNEAQLYIDGNDTFVAIFAAMATAKRYLLVQFFIVHDDELGRKFRDVLIAAAGRGVKVYFLYDEMGSHALPQSYKKELLDVGIDIRPFKTTKGAKNRFQINFRNHRKIVVADGEEAFVGGHNVGDEYLGKDKKFGRWRDTHVRVRGPAVAQVQVSFVEDWHWSSGSVPAVDWQRSAASTGGKSVLVLPSGPADALDTCCLFFLQAINAAKDRLWITSPYFVPDPQIISALQLAAMRGVDVRIILPHMADHLFVYWASFSYLREALPLQVNLYRYQGGFIHEKVLLVDDALAAVGTANFDNRSFRLNFEITLLFADKGFCAEVEQMLLDDLKLSKPVTMSEIDERSVFFKILVRVARLMAPIL